MITGAFFRYPPTHRCIHLPLLYIPAAHQQRREELFRVRGSLPRLLSASRAKQHLAFSRGDASSAPFIWVLCPYGWNALEGLQPFARSWYCKWVRSPQRGRCFTRWYGTASPHGASPSLRSPCPSQGSQQAARLPEKAFAFLSHFLWTRTSRRFPSSLPSYSWEGHKCKQTGLFCKYFIILQHLIEAALKIYPQC